MDTFQLHFSSARHRAGRDPDNFLPTVTLKRRALWHAAREIRFLVECGAQRDAAVSAIRRVLYTGATGQR